jgi:hypothetical protein
LRPFWFRPIWICHHGDLGERELDADLGWQ